MINNIIFEMIDTSLKSIFSKIYHVFVLDPTKVFTPIQIKLGLLKNLLQQWIKMAMDL